MKKEKKINNTQNPMSVFDDSHLSTLHFQYNISGRTVPGKVMVLTTEATGVKQFTAKPASAGTNKCLMLTEIIWPHCFLMRPWQMLGTIVATLTKSLKYGATLQTLLQDGTSVCPLTVLVCLGSPCLL